MLWIILFYLGAIGLTVMIIVKARALSRATNRGHETSLLNQAWFVLHPEAINDALLTAKNHYVKPTLRWTLIGVYRVYQVSSARARKYLRTKFYNLLHYSMHREMGHGVSDFMRDITHHRKAARDKKKD